MAAVQAFADARRPGARHLQRLPGPARGRPAAGRDAAQPRPEVPLRARPRPRRADRHAVHRGVPPRPGAADSDRARRGQLLRRRPTCSRGSRRIGRSSSATSTPPARSTDDGQPERLAQQHRRHLQRARNVVGLMPHPERACELVARQRRRPGRSSSRSCSREAGRSAAAGSLAAVDDVIDAQILERHGLKPDEYDRIVRAARPRAEPDRARHLLGDVVGALQLQELARPPARRCRPTGPRVLQGPGRERRRRRHRRRPGRGLQDRVAQPSVVHRAVSGRGDRRRRHHPRHLHDGRAADRAAELAALRLARRRRWHAAICRRRRRRHRRLRQQHRHPDRRRRDCLRRVLRRQSAGQRVLPRHRAGTTRSSRARRRASATRSTTSAPRPAATASTARRWRRRSSTRSRRRSGRRCRSAIRSWRSCCSRRASR